MAGIHQWNPVVDGRVYKHIHECKHGNLNAELVDKGLEVDYLPVASDAHKAVVKVINQRHLVSAIQRCNLALPTDYLENLHSVLLKYTPKRKALSE